MILCVGVTGSGKTMLLRQMQEHGLNLLKEAKMDTMTSEVTKPSTTPKISTALTSVPTIGTDLITLSRPSAVKKSMGRLPNETMVVREVGGAMAALWNSYIEPGKTKGILYVVDTSAPECIGNSTIHLVELLTQPSLEAVSVYIVFSKTDLQSSRSLCEIQSIMRLEHIQMTSKQSVTSSTFNIYAPETLDEVFNWCFKFYSPPPPEENDDL